jgi:phenylalanyl-tRNA synthetase alpha chain
MDPEERKVQGAAIHAVREAINNALTERQKHYNKLHCKKISK